MSGAEPQLPLDVDSTLQTAAEAIRDCVQTWGDLHWGSLARVHPGGVTLRFLIEQSGHAPRSIITAIDGTVERQSGGAKTYLNVTWQWFVVADGTLEDRARLGWLLVGEGSRLIVASPWSSVAAACFGSKPKGKPAAGGPRFRALYTDPDENAALSIWLLQWRQSIELGTGSRPPDPDPRVPLDTITGVSTIPGDPEDATIETEIPVP